MPLLAATLLCHLVSGYIAFLSLAPLALLSSSSESPDAPTFGALARRISRLVLLAGLAILTCSYFIVPLLLHVEFLNRGVWNDPRWYDSFGHERVLSMLVTGELFDFGRSPSLTVLVAIGLVCCVWHWRQERYRVPVALFVMWLLLNFGRPTWGVLLELLPMSHDMHFIRLSAGVHLAGIYLMGIALAEPWRWSWARRDARFVLAVIAVMLLLLYPVYRERLAYLSDNRRFMVDSAGAFESERREIAALFDVLRSAPPGRVYAGLGGNWGQRYRVGSVPMYALVTNSGFDTLGYLYHTLSLSSDLQALFDERRPEHYNLFNVRYVIAPADQPFPDFVVPWQSFGRHRLYRVTTSGYFDLVRSDKTLAAERHEFYLGGSRWLASDLPSLAVHPRLLFGRAARDLPAVPRFSQVTEVIPTSSIGPEPPLGRILLEELTLDSYTVEIEVERPATLMFKGTYHPNWQIYFHNKPVEPSAIAPSFVGIPLIPGEHTIRLEYRSGPLRSLLMLVGIVVLAAIVVAERPGWFWHRRRAPDDRRLDPDAEDDQGLLRIRM